MSPALMLAVASPAEDPADTIRRLQALGGWTFEFKFDGIRALCQIAGGVVTITNRTGRDITFRYPDVVAALTGLGDMILDGEIVCLTDGRPDFHHVQQRDAQGSARSAARLAEQLPAEFVAFDVLTVGGVDMRVLSYLDRREHLGHLAPQLKAHHVVVPPVSDNGPVMWKAACDLGLEGLVAKRNDSRYTGRRSGSWLKLKLTHRVSALVSGYDPGEGSRARTFGALRLSLLDENNELVDVGSVGSGFRDVDIVNVWQLLRTEQHPIVVEVAYLEVGATGHLRQPVFRGLRSDLSAQDCRMDQLE